MNFEKQYIKIINELMTFGDVRRTRNGTTMSLFAKTIDFDLQDGFPLLRGRKIFYKGVLGEFAAFLRGPKHLKDFEKFGCNYWKLWAKKNGSINVDYGNTWINWGNKINQLDNVIKLLKDNPYDRRLLITGWNPSNLKKLDLPCCHYAYQWYVRESNGNKYLDMIWNQRSADLMIGVPSDIVLAAIWNIALAAHVNMLPGKVKMIFGDTHVYEEHYDGMFEYIHSLRDCNLDILPDFKYKQDNIYNFTPSDLEIQNYNVTKTIKFKLKA